jgi:hypothetical protein
LWDFLNKENGVVKVNSLLSIPCTYHNYQECRQLHGAQVVSSRSRAVGIHGSNGRITHIVLEIVKGTAFEEKEVSIMDESINNIPIVDGNWFREQTEIRRHRSWDDRIVPWRILGRHCDSRTRCHCHCVYDVEHSLTDTVLVLPLKGVKVRLIAGSHDSTDFGSLDLTAHHAAYQRTLTTDKQVVKVSTFVFSMTEAREAVKVQLALERSVLGLGKEPAIE